MALFERITPDFLPILSRIGFAARLRWELSDTFVSLSSENKLSRITDRKKAAVFFFVSNAKLGSTSSLCAVLTKPNSSSDYEFLTLAHSPTLTSRPTVLKIAYSKPVTANRCLVSLQQPKLSGGYLSLAGNKDAIISPKLSKRELFHLEFIPGSIGTGFSHFEEGIPALSPAQALSNAFLALGVRFRLRSIHQRVLRTSNEEKGVHVVVQNGPQTKVSDKSENELVMTPYRVEHKDKSHDENWFVFKDVTHGKIFSLQKGNERFVPGNALSPSPVLLRNQADPKPVRVKFSSSNFGAVHLGCSDGEDVEWLMGGRRGRLELRRNHSSWETFIVEIVRQSLEGAVNDIPKSSLFQAALTETEEEVRANIKARIAQAKANEGKSSKKFNHAAALAGLSDQPKSQKSTNEQRNKGSSVNTNKSPASTSTAASKNADSKHSAKKKNANKTRAAAASTAAASLPRNQANRKVSKQNKKKQKKARKAQAAKEAARAAATQANSASASGSVRSPSQKGNKRSEDSDSKENVESSGEVRNGNSSSNKQPAGNIGPPCAACGRRIEGNYTTAKGKNYHPSCFCCGRCRCPLIGGVQYREHNGVQYCNRCYAEYLAPRCARCSKPILDSVVTAMEKTWHKECLICVICALPLTETFWVYPDKPNEPRCSRCVTGSENYQGRRYGNGRAVNLPGLGNPSSYSGGMPFASGQSGTSSGRVRLMPPIMPNTARR